MHNLANRLRNYRSRMPLFTPNPEVAPTNNLDEKDIRPLKLKQKILSCFRTRVGSLNLAIFRNIIETIRKYGWGMLLYCKQTPINLSKVEKQRDLARYINTITLNQ